MLVCSEYIGSFEKIPLKTQTEAENSDSMKMDLCLKNLDFDQNMPTHVRHYPFEVRNPFLFDVKKSLLSESFIEELNESFNRSDENEIYLRPINEEELDVSERPLLQRDDDDEPEKIITEESEYLYPENKNSLDF